MKGQQKHPAAKWVRWLFIASLCLFLGLMGVQKYRHDQLTQNIDRARIVKVRPVQTKKMADDNAPQPTYWDEDTRGITVGKLAIPSVGIKLPIIKGIGQTNGHDNMLKAAVTNKQGQTMGKRNYVLSSHDIAQENVLFSPLNQTKVGAAIYLTDTKQVYTYRVISRKTVKANQVAILDDVRQKRLVTLYTCDPDGEIVNGQTYERTVVVGELVQTTKASAKTLTPF